CLLFSFVIVFFCAAISSFATETDRPGTFFSDQQIEKAQQIKERYGIDTIFLYTDQLSEETDQLRQFTKDYLIQNQITNKYFVLAENPEYYYYEWSEDLDDVFHSIDGTYIVNSISYDESGNLLSPGDAEDLYYDLLAKMLENRTNCPYKYIIDQAGVLTDAEEKEINNTLISFREKNKFDLVVVLTNGVSNSDRMPFADDYYDYNGYAKDGALLLVNINEFDTYTKGNSWISTSGSCIDLISSDDISDIGSDLTPLLLDGNYFEAVNKFPDLVNRTIKAQKVGTYGAMGAVTAAVCVIVAFIYCGKLKRQLKSVQDAIDANDYIVGNSLNIARAYDHYLYSHVTKTERQSKSSSGSSSHTSSSGSSHGGGGF
ncbi:MAG: TPM domain-containing protein, partial [Clostridia bacterium]|nr:TPM domain-containing protein [Clostridia bacterium]